MSPRPSLVDVRRPQILDAAARSIVERGMRGTRIADVAEHVGATSGTVLHYFASKDELLEEALTFADERFYAAALAEIETVQGGHERLERLIALSSHGAAVRDNWVMWVEASSVAIHSAAVRAARRRSDRRWREIIAGVVRYGQARGEFGPGDPGEVARLLASLSDGLGVQLALHDPDITPGRMVELFLAVARAQLARPGADHADAEGPA
jgi:AcrR family transcriptional regulator